MKATWAIALAGCLSPLLAFAEAPPLTMANCVDIALGRSPDLQIAKLDLHAADEMIWAARAALWPNVTARVSAVTLSGNPATPFSILRIADPEGNPIGAGSSQVVEDTTTTRTSSTTVTRAGKSTLRDTTETTTNVNRTVSHSSGEPAKPISAHFPVLGFGAVSLSYPLFKDGSILGLNQAPAVQSAKAQKVALAWTKDLTSEQAIFIAANAYLTAATRAERLRLDARRVELTEGRLANIQQQTELGLKLVSDLKFAQEQVSSSRRMLALSRQQDEAARIYLASLLGLSPRKLSVSTHLPAPPALPEIDKVLATARGKHPGMGVQNAVIEQRLNDCRVARAQLMPVVSFGTSYLQGVDLSASGNQNLYTATLSVDVPIFDFGTQRAKVRAAQDRYAAEQIRLTKVGDEIRNAILDTYGMLIVTAQNVAVARRDVAQASQSYDLARLQTQAGLVAPLVATDAELQLVDRQEVLNDQQARELAQFATLQNVAGGVWKWLR